MTALYQQVSDGILKQIQTGALPVGDKLPPEADYAAMLGVSRSTLRLAFAELEKLGVLQRKKKAGTKIISDQPKPQFNMNTNGFHELLSLGRDTEFVVTGTRTVATGDVPYLEGYEAEADHWLEVSGTRTLASETLPFNSAQIYVPARYSAIEPDLKRTRTSVFKVIEDRFGVTVGRVSQDAKAIACPAQAAAIIGLKTGAPALQIVAELSSRDGRLMEISVATFDPERFQLKTDVEIE